MDATPIPIDRAGFYYLVSEVGPDGEGSLGDATIDLDVGTPGIQLERPNNNPCP